VVEIDPDRGGVNEMKKQDLKKDWNKKKIELYYAEIRESAEVAAGTEVILSVSEKTLKKYGFGRFESNDFFKEIFGFAPYPILKNSVWFTAPVEKYFEEIKKNREQNDARVKKHQAEKELSEKKYGKYEENSDF